MKVTVTANPQFRKATPLDVDIVIALIREYYAFDHIPFNDSVVRPALQELLENTSYGQVWLIFHNEVDSGYMVLTYGFDIEFGGRQATITDLYLRPHARGCGLGKTALQIAEQTCRLLGIHALELQVSEDNLTALHLYEKFGLQKHDRIPMSKELTP